LVKVPGEIGTICALVQVLYFSPTGGTRRIISKIAENIGLKLAPRIDLTLSEKRKSFKGRVEGDLLLVGTPVYAGTIPYPFLTSLQQLHGEGKWAVSVAVYGNRSPDTAMEELTKVLRGRGFKILAEASFIARHSFATPQHPWAIGRPDETDMMAAAQFGKGIGRKLRSSLTEVSVPSLLMDRISNTMVEALPEGYHKKILDRPKELFQVSVSDRDLCTGCKNCSNSCPTDAVDADTLQIDDHRCIRCVACVRACPQGVLKLVYSDSPSALETYARLDKIFAVRKEAKTFL